MSIIISIRNLKSIIISGNQMTLKNSFHSDFSMSTITKTGKNTDFHTKKSFIQTLKTNRILLMQNLTKTRQTIRKRLFNFEDISTLTQRDVQRLLRDVETQELAVAMKNASEAVKRVFFGAMSKRASESLKEEIEIQGPVRNKDIEAAQDRIIAQIMQLSEAGEIDISQEDSSESAG